MTVQRILNTSPNVDTDASGLGHYVLAEQLALDGTGTPQQLSCNQDLTVLPSAARTATTSSADQINRNGRGVMVFLNITAASGTGGLTIKIQGKDPVSGNYISIYTAGSAATATGTFPAVVYPGVGTTISGASDPLPATWRVQVQHGDASNYTYSVGASVIL